MAEQNTYPSISEKNWWVLRDKFKSSLPATVSATYIKTLLTLGSEDSAKNNVILPLKRLGLIDENNKPTQLANDWRLDDKYKSACDTMIRNIYPQELLDLFSSGSIERSAIVSWFMGSGVGTGAANKMAALFSLLQGGEIKEEPIAKVVAPKTTTQKLKASAKQKNTASKTHDTEAVNRAHNTESPQNKSSQPDLHIDLQIHISPDSTPEQIDTIFASMAKHLYGVNNT